MAFAVTGAFKAIEHKSDIVGIVILSTITGGCRGSHTGYNIWKISSYCCRQPPLYYNNCEHCNSNFFLYPLLKKHWNLFLKFDAVGLGIFTVIGSTFAYNAFGLNFLAMSFSGVLTAIGGGI